MKYFSLTLLTGLTLAALNTSIGRADTENVIIFFVDDMGWTDLGCTGSDLYETPNIDALAGNGIKFTSGYAACTVCSPSRAALMTGQSPARLKVTDFIPGHPFVNTPLTIPDWTKVLEHKHLTMPELLKEHGFVSAHIGKWHLSHRDGYVTGKPDTPDPDNFPVPHGFDYNIGGCEKGAPPSYFWPYGRGKTLEEKKQNTIFDTLPKDGKADADREGEYLTDRLADEAVKLIDQFASDDTPFFINFAFYNVHTPIMGRPDLVEKYKAKLEKNPNLNHTNAEYAAMVESVDEAVGKVISKLEETGQRDNTLLIFTSDNGGLKPAATDNSPLRQGKGGIYEGGIRVPLIIDLPGNEVSGKNCHHPVITMDILPTVFEAIGKPLPAEVTEVLDGKSLVPILKDPRGPFDRKSLYWHYPHYHSMGAQPYSAIRSGNWKLIEVIGQGKIELYDLSSDIHEHNDLARSELDKTKELYFELANWRKSIGAQMPTVNKEFDPEKPTGVKRGEKLKPAAPLRD